MDMDPVVALMETLRAVEAAMSEACKANARRYCSQRAERINEMLARVKAGYAEILNTSPTSPLGASIIIRIVAGRMPFAYARTTDHLHRIAGRLEHATRLHTDLVWLRAVAAALCANEAGHAAKLGLLIGRAIAGIARPVLIWRAVLPPVCQPTDWRELAQGPR